MSSGKKHEKINDLFFVLIMVSAGLFGLYQLIGKTEMIYGGMFIVGYFTGTYYLSPDLDLPSRPYYRWGKLKIIWKPYQKLFKHRSLWTHGFIIGDLIRLIYIGVILILLERILFSELKTIPFLLENKLYAASYICGVCLASTFHIISDHTSTKLKKIKNRRQKKAGKYRKGRK